MLAALIAFQAAPVASPTESLTLVGLFLLLMWTLIERLRNDNKREQERIRFEKLLNDEIEDERNKRRALESRLADSEKKAERAEKQAEETTKQLDAIKRVREQERAELMQRLEAAEIEAAQVPPLRKEVDQLKSHVGELNSRVEYMTQEHQKMEQLLASERQENTKLREENAKLKEENAQLKQSGAEKDAENARLVEEINNLKARCVEVPPAEAAGPPPPSDALSNEVQG